MNHYKHQYQNVACRHQIHIKDLNDQKIIVDYKSKEKNRSFSRLQDLLLKNKTFTFCVN